jgi:flagellum-specific peptidoglycan hydrolase FlgJ
MTTSPQVDFLIRAATTAHLANHPWPEYAACEAALESSWGRSTLALRANNLFGQKQSHPPVGSGTLRLPTREFIRGQWVDQIADWVVFPDWTASFDARMALLRRMAPRIPAYAAALNAACGEEFIEQVSLGWSTGPMRASQVLAIYRAHQAQFDTPSLSA